MDDTAAAHVDGHVSVIADDISGLGIGESVDSPAPLTDPGIIVGKRDPETRVDSHDKSRAVAAVCQTASSPFVGVADKLHCIVDELLSLCIAGGGAPVLSVDFAAVGIDRAVIVENQFLPMFYLIGSLLDTLGIKVIDLMADVLEACQAVQLFHADIIALAADLLPACEETSSFVDTSVIVVLLVFDPALFQDALGTENIIIIPDFLQAFEGIAFFVEVIGLVSDRLPAALEVFSVGKPVAVFPVRIDQLVFLYYIRIYTGAVFFVADRGCGFIIRIDKRFSLSPPESSRLYALCIGIDDCSGQR